MNQREAILAGVMGLIAVAYVAPKLADRFFFAPVRAKDQQLDNLQQQVKLKQKQLAEAQDNEYDLKSWATKALPADPHVAQTLYEQYLHQVLGDLDIRQPLVTPTAPQARNDHYLRLPFQVRAFCSLEQASDFFHAFYSTPLFHQIRHVSLKPVMREGRQGFDLNVQIEAVSLRDAVAKDRLPATVDAKKLRRDRARELAIVVDKNIFQPTRFVDRDRPPPPRDDRGNIYLTGSVSVDGVAHVWLTNRREDRRFVVAQGANVDLAGIRAQVSEVAPDHVVLTMDGQRGVVRLGQSLANWRKETTVSKANEVIIAPAGDTKPYEVPATAVKPGA